MSEIRVGVRTVAAALVDALERRAVNKPFPSAGRRRLIAAFEQLPALRRLLPLAEADAAGEQHADAVVTYLRACEGERAH
jgi:hypothetical protein